MTLKRAYANGEDGITVHRNEKAGQYYRVVHDIFPAGSFAVVNDNGSLSITNNQVGGPVAAYPAGGWNHVVPEVESVDDSK
ncbi:hypothetical protein PQI66_09935 [Corynebacterium sp. USCH3]|uniref:hypothetical protein n=1 Tax=Corynebacterium sp. USCH3 TaxID=3024840 RepID=UPI0030AD2BA5